MTIYRRPTLWLNLAGLGGEHLADNELRKDPSVFRVSLHQPAGLGEHAMQPLQPDALHPAWGSTPLVGEKVNCRSDAECNAGRDSLAIGMYPAFLFGRAQSDDEDIRLAGADSLENRFGFFGAFFKAERWAVTADDLYLRPSLLDVGCSFFRNARRGSEQVDGQRPALLSRSE